MSTPKIHTLKHLKRQKRKTKSRKLVNWSTKIIIWVTKLFLKSQVLIKKVSIIKKVQSDFKWINQLKQSLWTFALTFSKHRDSELLERVFICDESQFFMNDLKTRTDQCPGIDQTHHRKKIETELIKIQSHDVSFLTGVELHTFTSWTVIHINMLRFWLPFLNEWEDKG